MASLPRGVDLLHDPRLNKGTAFTEAERDALGLRGLLPPRVFTQAEQVRRVMESFRAKPDNLERYIYLTSLQDRNERLFYRVVMDHLEEMMPIIYTPTVGEACRQFAHIFRRPRGLYVTARDRGRVRVLLQNWPEPEVAIIVVTDGERVLGLGDLGANGMGIPIGKLALYTACAGVAPALGMPVLIDVGTDRAELLADPLYLGLPQRRVRGAEYDALLDEFVMAVQEAFPGALIQFEDFATPNALGLLERYRDRVPAFNDDIQGTAAVVLAGILSAGRVSGRRLRDETVLFLGAGAAAVGIADLVASALEQEGLSPAEARRHCWFVDPGGLVVQGRGDLRPYHRRYAHEHPGTGGLLEAVEALRPTVLIGVSTQGGAFTEPVIRAMARFHERPVVFPLSNPTSRSECTAEQAYRWSEGRALFASGSPFGPVAWNGRQLIPGQANNAYIFPGIGLGVLAARARRVTDQMFHLAARTLAGLVTESALEQGRLFPPLAEVREVSRAIGTAVARAAWGEGLARRPRPPDISAYVQGLMYQPDYPSYV
jgi:malate dehydrogenase (oxaloacetate-decarboxylating)(NADP+)